MTWTAAIKLWHDEITKFAYNRDSNVLSDVGHYTQVCRYTRYTSIFKHMVEYSFLNAYFVLCFFWGCGEGEGNAFSTIFNSYIVAFSIIGRGNRKGAHRGDRRTASNNLTISKIKVVLSTPRQDSHYITLVDYIL